MSTTPRGMTDHEKIAAIVTLLKDEHGEWRENVEGADFIQDVSMIIDEPTTPPAVDDATLALLAQVAEDATDLLDCNCSPRCDGSCTYSMAKAALAALKKGAQPPAESDGLRAALQTAAADFDAIAEHLDGLDGGGPDDHIAEAAMRARAGRDAASEAAQKEPPAEAAPVLKTWLVDAGDSTKGPVGFVLRGIKAATAEDALRIVREGQMLAEWIEEPSGRLEFGDGGAEEVGQGGSVRVYFNVQALTLDNITEDTTDGE